MIPYVKRELLDDKDREIIHDELWDSLLNCRISDVSIIIRDCLHHISDEYLLAFHDLEIENKSDISKSIRKKLGGNYESK
tara:strand:+ start:811 stop:1050 length:240 start_codon:yes stop_codon:yes gene_type:complete